MAFLPLLLNLLTFIPTIVAKVQAEHAEKDVITKTQIAQDWLGVATQVSAGVLPPADAALATEAGTVAQGVLAATVQAVHDASQPSAASVAPASSTAPAIAAS